MKFGADYRVQQLNQFQSNFFGGQFSFNNQMTAINPQRLDTNSGIGMASFLHGIRCGRYRRQEPAISQPAPISLSSFVQDDWKLGRKLTLNLGVEYGLEFPITERYNRKMWFDPDAILPISSGVNLDLRGGYRFADADTRSPYDLFKARSRQGSGLRTRRCRTPLFEGDTACSGCPLRSLKSPAMFALRHGQSARACSALSMVD